MPFCLIVILNLWSISTESQFAFSFSNQTLFHDRTKIKINRIRFSCLISTKFTHKIESGCQEKSEVSLDFSKNVQYEIQKVGETSEKLSIFLNTKN